MNRGQATCVATVPLIVAAALMLGDAPVHAASFDCGKAHTAFARAICTHPDLSKADDAVATALAAALIHLSSPARTRVQRDHDAWVQFANRACTKDARPATHPYDANGVQCLQQVFADRTEQLQHVGNMGGLTFYYVDLYAALRDPDPVDNFSTIATKMASTPRMDGTSPEALAFNRFVTTETRGDLDPAIAAHPRPEDGNEDDTDTMLVTTVTPARITMAVSSGAYPHGAAHGSYGVSYIHYLRGPQRRLVAADIFTAPDWQPKVQQLALAAVKTAEGEDLLLDDPKSIDPLVIDPARWDFSKDGLVLQFEPYEIAPFAAGAPTVTLPWSSLTALLAPGAAAITG